MISIDSPLKLIVLEHPECSSVLEKFGLDFCCGGNETLGEACSHKNVQVDTVTSALRDVIVAASSESLLAVGGNDEGTKLSEMSAAELVHEIIGKHHEYLRTEIPPLKQLLDKVCRVHGGRHGELSELQIVVHAALDALMTHIDDEESGLFKVLLQEGNQEELSHDGEAVLRNWVSTLEHEHVEHGQALERIKTLTTQYTPPADGCASYRALFARLKHLEEDTHLHVHKENYVLFPKVLAMIDSNKAASISYVLSSS